MNQTTNRLLPSRPSAGPLTARSGNAMIMLVAGILLIVGCGVWAYMAYDSAEQLKRTLSDLRSDDINSPETVAYWDNRIDVLDEHLREVSEQLGLYGESGDTGDSDEEDADDGSGEDDGLQGPRIGPKVPYASPVAVAHLVNIEQAGDPAPGQEVAEGERLRIDRLLLKAQQEEPSYTDEWRAMYDPWIAQVRDAGEDAELSILAQQLQADQGVEIWRRTLEVVLDAHELAVRARLDRIRQLATERAADLADVDAAADDVKAEIAELEERRGELLDNIQDLRERIVRVDREKRETAVRSQEEIADLKIRLAESETEYKNRESALQQQVAELRSRLEEIRSAAEAGKGTEDPDATVVESDLDAGYAWIDIGRSSGVREGMEFQIFRYLKGGEKKLKGVGVVREVGDLVTTLALVGGVGGLDDPIQKGDLVFNTGFDPGKTRTFALAGDFTGRWSREDLVHRIREMGGEVVEEVTEEVDFLVLGEGGLGSEKYQRALDLSIEILTTKRLAEEFFRR